MLIQKPGLIKKLLYHHNKYIGFCFAGYNLGIKTLNMEAVEAIIETPKGSAEKYAYDPEKRLFKLKKILPSGMVFPYDFGFIPGTKGGDGDPLDVIVISEFKSFPGCLLDCRIIGAIIAEQTEKKETMRNDRYIGIPVQGKSFKKIKSIEDLPEEILEELENFFINYNDLEGKKFKPLKRLDAKEANKEINKSVHA